MSVTSSQSHYQELEAYRTRSHKLQEIEALGVDAYPHTYKPSHHAQGLHDNQHELSRGNSEEAASGTTEPVCVAGRIVLLRAMGKNVFAQLQDGTGRIQLMFNRDSSRVVGYDPDQTNATQAPGHLKFIEKKGSAHETENIVR